MPSDEGLRRNSKHQATFQCSLCPKRFTRSFNLRGHLIGSHTDERPFACTVCGLGFVRNHDRKSHELIHKGEKKFVCGGALANGQQWGCGRRFNQKKNLSRHFESRIGRMCTRQRVEEEMSTAWWAASALTGMADSSSAPEQDRHMQPSFPEQTQLYNEPVIPIDFTPNHWVSNEGLQLSPTEQAIPRLPVTAPPTRDEALKAADTVRRYIRYHGRLNTEENGFYGYLELTFKSMAVSQLGKPNAVNTSTIDPVFLSGTLAS